jgi:zinc protease
VAIGYKSPALGDFDHAPLTILNEILFGGRSSRAHRKLVQQTEIATEVRGWVGTFRDPALYDIASPRAASTRARSCSRRSTPSSPEVKKGGVTEAELDRAKARLELGVLQSLETVAGKAEQIGFYDTVLGDPAALFDRLEADPPRHPRRRPPRRAPLPRDQARTIVFVRPDEATRPKAPKKAEGDEGEEAAA